MEYFSERIYLKETVVIYPFYKLSTFEEYLFYETNSRGSVSVIVFGFDNHNQNLLVVTRYELDHVYFFFFFFQFVGIVSIIEEV